MRLVQYPPVTEQIRDVAGYTAGKARDMAGKATQAAKSTMRGTAHKSVGNGKGYSAAEEAKNAYERAKSNAIEGGEGTVRKL